MIFSKVLVVYSSSKEYHLKLSCSYAKQIASSMEKAGLEVSLWDEFERPDFEFTSTIAAEKPELVLLFTHGCAVQSENDCHPSCLQTNSKSCVTGWENLPIMRMDQVGAFAGITVYAATCCYVGGEFAKAAVSHGAKGVLGYSGLFIHVPVDEIGDNPFFDIVNITDAVRDGTNLYEFVSGKYQHWLNTMSQNRGSMGFRAKFLRSMLVKNFESLHYQGQ